VSKRKRPAALWEAARPFFRLITLPYRLQDRFKISLWPRNREGSHISHTAGQPPQGKRSSLEAAERGSQADTVQWVPALTVFSTDAEGNLHPADGGVDKTHSELRGGPGDIPLRKGGGGWAKEKRRYESCLT